MNNPSHHFCSINPFVFFVREKKDINIYNYIKFFKISNSNRMNVV